MVSRLAPWWDGLMTNLSNAFVCSDHPVCMECADEANFCTACPDSFSTIVASDASLGRNLAFTPAHCCADNFSAFSAVDAGANERYQAYSTHAFNNAPVTPHLGEPGQMLPPNWGGSHVSSPQENGIASDRPGIAPRAQKLRAASLRTLAQSKGKPQGHDGPEIDPNLEKDESLDKEEKGSRGLNKGETGSERLEKVESGSNGDQRLTREKKERKATASQRTRRSKSRNRLEVRPGYSKEMDVDLDLTGREPFVDSVLEKEFGDKPSLYEKIREDAKRDADWILQVTQKEHVKKFRAQT